MLFAVVLIVIAFELVSLVYLYRASTDFIIARREQRLPVYVPGDVVSWRGASVGQLYGWARADAMGAFSIGPSATLAVRISDRSPGDLELRVLADGLIDPQTVRRREISVVINERPLARWSFDTAGPALQRVRIPETLVAPDGAVRVTFGIHEHRSPRALGRSPDPRAIGFRVIEWQILRLERTTGDDVEPN